VDADTSRHLGDRSARIEMQANGLVPVFLGEASACRHAISSAGNQRQSRPSVYKIGYGPALKGPKRHQAVSGYWHTLTTLAHYCRIRSYLISTRNHDIRAIDAIHTTLTGTPWLPTVSTA
jgi:hypothetical protein